MDYYLAVRFAKINVKKVVPLNWCSDLKNINELVLHRTYKVRFDEQSPRVEEAYILKHFSKYILV